MKSTNKYIYIKDNNRKVYLKNGKHYYRYRNEYHLIKRRLTGGDEGEDGGKEKEVDGQKEEQDDPKAEQKDIDKFIEVEKFTNKKVKLFEKVVKYYKDYLDVFILDKIKKSIDFLTKYNNKINVIIDMFKHNDNGELSSDQIRMLITYIKKFIFDKIFVNYFIDIISIYYDNSRSAKKEIEDAMHMLTFVENDRKEELLYSQKINILLERLIENGIKNTNDREKYYVDFSNYLIALKDGESDDADEVDKTNGEYKDLSIDKFERVKPMVLKDLKEKFEKQELILINIQGTLYWWDKISTIVEKEFKETDGKYIKAFEIFINELLRETIYYDIDLEEKIENKKPEEEQLDPELYEIYRKFIRTTFIKKIKSRDITRQTINGTLSDSEYNIRLDRKNINFSSDEEGLKRNFIRMIDESIKKRKDEKKETSDKLIDTRQKTIISNLSSNVSESTVDGSAELLNAQTVMEKEEKKLVKMKKKLNDKVLKYIEILNIMVTAKEQKDITYIDDEGDNGDKDDDEDKKKDNMVNKSSFKEMASILIVYLKQHILSFSVVYKQIIRDIKNVHKALLQEIEELENKIKG